MYSRYYKLMIVVLRFMYSYQHTVLFIGNYQYVAIIGISLCMYYVLIWTELYNNIYSTRTSESKMAYDRYIGCWIMYILYCLVHNEQS